MKKLLLAQAGMLVLLGCGETYVLRPAPPPPSRLTVVKTPSGAQAVKAGGPGCGRMVAVKTPKGTTVAAARTPSGRRIVAVKQPSGLVKPVALPKPKLEMKPPKPPGRWIWVSGHWQWNRTLGKYVWVKGRWERARAGKRWVPGRYVMRSNVHVWIPGHWR